MISTPLPFALRLSKGERGFFSNLLVIQNSKFKIELPRSKLRGIEKLYDNFPESCHPRMFLSGVQSEFRLDSR